jgi:hypothetical protein
MNDLPGSFLSSRKTAVEIGPYSTGKRIFFPYHALTAKFASWLLIYQKTGSNP